MKILSDASKSIRPLVLLLVSLVLLSIIALIALSHWDLLKEHTFGQEIGKGLLQVISVSVIGTTASLLLAEFNRAQAVRQKQKDHKREKEQEQIERQRRLNENKDQFRKEILHKANQSYADTKRARRLLRARGFSTPFAGVWDGNTPILLEVYDKYMESINDAQLELEVIGKEIAFNKQAFSSPELVKGYVEEMEGYLGLIVSEFEKHRADFSGTPASLPIAQLKEMRAMLGPAEGSPFINIFATRYKDVINSIRTDLLTSPKLNS
jgi:uncharacterized small protein (DUF1192 family)